MIKQKTIKNIVELNGIGLHSGKTVNMKIMPAGAACLLVPIVAYGSVEQM